MKWEMKKIILTLLSSRYVYDIHLEMSESRIFILGLLGRDKKQGYSLRVTGI